VLNCGPGRSAGSEVKNHCFSHETGFLCFIDRSTGPAVQHAPVINDHTEGLKLGAFTPSAHVADNDWAVGLFVEYLSKSKIWNESAVFILEDDAQGGPDHVDAHRSTVTSGAAG